MVAPSELRLGNIVAFSDRMVRITSISDSTLEGVTRIGEILSSAPDLAMPVLLTEKILESYGFERNVHPYDRSLSYSLTIIITPNIGNPDAISVTFGPNQPPVGRLRGGSHSSSHEFYYLHQLQNLFHSVMRRELKPAKKIAGTN